MGVTHMTPKYLTRIVLSFLILSGLNEGFCPAQEEPKPANQAKTSAVVEIKIENHFLLYLPDNYEKQESFPLLLFLHGAGERGNEELDKVAFHGPPKQIKNGKVFSVHCRLAAMPKRQLVGSMAAKCVSGSLRVQLQGRQRPDLRYRTKHGWLWNLGSRRP